ncbi:MAG: hypothetical protein ACRD3S_20710, partial [Terracidiphilus sp.]
MNRLRASLSAMCFVVLIAYTQSCAIVWSQTLARDIRSVDFKNFSYPWAPPDGWPDHLQWMSLRLQHHVRLLNGKWNDHGESGGL